MCRCAEVSRTLDLVLALNEGRPVNNILPTQADLHIFKVGNFNNMYVFSLVSLPFQVSIDQMEKIGTYFRQCSGNVTFWNGPDLDLRIRTFD
jgi:hypothetical protein